MRLTVCGHTRLGDGTCDPIKPDAVKELISDALKNAAMRFGVALSLWSKSEAWTQPEPPPDPDAWYAAHGWFDRAEHDQWRTETLAVLEALPAAAQARFKEWRQAAGTPGFGGPHSRDQADLLAAEARRLAGAGDEGGAAAPGKAFAAANGTTS